MKLHKPFGLVMSLCLFLVTLHAQERYEYHHRQMGTQIRLVLYAVTKEKADSASKLVFERIDDLNQKLSDYLEGSELNKICQKPLENIRVSDDMFNILKTSLYISESTEGYFDVSAGPLIDLWRSSRRTKVFPPPDAIASALEKVGYEHISLPRKNTIYLRQREMDLDLGGIGKGYAADEALKVLSSQNIKSALIDMGGDISVSEAPENSKYWTLAFTYFDKDKKEVVQKIRLCNQAVATSGDLYKYVELDGKRYSHIVDPKTGWALDNGIQVTVIAEDGATADAMASALSVMGIDKSAKFLKGREDIKAFMVMSSKDFYQQWNNAPFDKHTIE